jgi:rhomboid protease GlpG
MIEALSVSSDQDLQLLSRYLWSLNIAHRISEQAHQQIIWVGNDTEVEQVQAVYEAWQQGDLQLKSMPQQQALNDVSGFQLAMSRLKAVPVISLMILVSMLVTGLLDTRFGDAVFGLFRMGTIGFMLESGELWRTITPIFLHFGLMHLAFNMVLLWVFGRQLELHEGRLTLLLLMLVFAVIPNLGQYLAAGINFGGMSGVVYAVLGYCWLLNRLSPQPVYAFPPALMGLMVVWLLIGFSDLLTWVGFPAMANIAHLGGLLSGLAAAWVMSVIRRTKNLK